MASSDVVVRPPLERLRAAASSGDAAETDQADDADPAHTILKLPNELIIQVLCYLDGHSLARVARTSRRLSGLCSDDRLWSRSLAHLRLSSPRPYSTYRSLYSKLHRHLWLSSRLWFSDKKFTGRILLARYNPVNGSIDLADLLANRPGSVYTPSVLPQMFNPIVSLCDPPLMSLTATSTPDEKGEIEQETSTHGISPVYVSLFRALAIPPHQQQPSMSLWPPWTIPAQDRVRNVSQQQFRGPSHRPKTPDHASPSTLRIRKWMRFKSTVPRYGVTLDDEAETFAALDPALLAPDTRHPWRGVWAGDYGLHGIELVLFTQPSQTSIEAVKLTGDINVPRGELTAKVDLGRLAEDQILPWDDGDGADAMLYQAEGQIAWQEFREAKWIKVRFVGLQRDAGGMWTKCGICWPEEDTGGMVSWFVRVPVEEFLYGQGAEEA